MKGRDEEREKERRPMVGIGETPSDDPDAWKPSKALRARDVASRGAKSAAQVRGEHPSPGAGGADACEQNADLWRPSEAVKERLRSLAPVRHRRRFALPKSMRLVASAVLFAIGIYAFAKLWTMPTETDLHPALIVFGAALILLLIAAIVSAVSRRRRAREDEKSTLRL